MSQFYCNTCDRLRSVRAHGYHEVQGQPMCEECHYEVSSPSPQAYPTPRTISGSTLPGSRKPHGEPGKENNDE
jgi:hypothetical protein